VKTLALRKSAVVAKSSVVTAWPGDRHAAVDVLVGAFESDPVVRWAFPGARGYRATFRAFAGAFGGRAFEHGTAQYVRGFRGAALWLPPGVGPDEGALVPLLQREVPSDRLDNVLAILEQMGRHHPDGPHWYLPLIGVDPAHQGRGHGTAMLRDACGRFDHTGAVAYLESTHPLNLPLYRRFGFECTGTIQVGAAPPVYPMVRRPR
jgi:ribosomal protein S18 acetylase RimI-like enzyme